MCVSVVWSCNSCPVKFCQERFYEFQDSSIGDSYRDPLHQQVPGYVVKTTGYVRIDHVLAAEVEVFHNPVYGLIGRSVH